MWCLLLSANIYGLVGPYSLSHGSKRQCLRREASWGSTFNPCFTFLPVQYGVWAHPSMRGVHFTQRLIYFCHRGQNTQIHTSAYYQHTHRHVLPCLSSEKSLKCCCILFIAQCLDVHHSLSLLLLEFSVAPEDTCLSEPIGSFYVFPPSF